MAIWAPASINEEPEITLIRWSVMALEDGSRHFVGARDDNTGRVSSAIREFDRKTMTGRTRSGRVYRLKGHPGFDADAYYVWQIWCMHNDIAPGTYANVTEEMTRC